MANLVEGEGQSEKRPGDSLSASEMVEMFMRRKDRKTVKAILNSLKKGAGMTEAAEKAGISFVTLWRWKRKFPRLNLLIETIQDSRIDEVEDAMFKAAKGGSVEAGKYILSRRKRDKYPEPSLLNQTINIGKQGKNDDREFEGRDADEQSRLREYFKSADSDAA